ncbi:hypothetical protein PIB30_105356 [Stylosanthes scabra]|uniref:Uncharacterized protein n=1 Tax=Stylosanthes scabra TaxID=79078 RepID=A0ABU6SYU2_9FABA|nr:hypothetical protein [Stylosanthes scabra]
MECIVVSGSLPCLRPLCMLLCGSLKSVSKVWTAAPQLEDLKILHCPNMDMSATGDPHHSLRSLEISYYERLVSSAAFIISQFQGLTHLYIWGKCKSLKSFPKEGWLPASLESLTLDSFKTVETLECKGLAHLTSLKELHVSRCPMLENIEGEKLPASLIQLIINDSPLLGKRCEMKDPQVWPKISHTQHVRVDRTYIH